jgi:hypothetical protein
MVRRRSILVFAGKSSAEISAILRADIEREAEARDEVAAKADARRRGKTAVMGR